MIKATIFLLLLFGLWACQDLNSVLPPDELDLSGRYGVYVDTTLYSTRDTFLVDYKINNNNSPKLSIGKYKDFESSILLKFQFLPAAGSVLDSVHIQFRGLSILGEPTSDLTVSVFEADMDWDASANASEEWHNHTPVNKITELQLSATDSTKYQFAIEDSSIYNQWLRDGNNNNGLFLKITDNNVDYIRELASFEYYYDSDFANFVPRLTYKILVNGVFEHDTLYTGIDASILDYNVTGDQNIFNLSRQMNELIISSGVAARTFIQFDGLNSLPTSALIQSANIFIPVIDEDFFIPDVENSFVNKNNSQGFYLRSVEDANDNLSYYKLDSVFTNANYNISLSKRDSIIYISDEDEEVKFGRNYIQNIVNGSMTSKWFYLQFKSEMQDLSAVRINGLSNEPVQLNIRYFKIERSVY